MKKEEKLKLRDEYTKKFSAIDKENAIKELINNDIKKMTNDGAILEAFKKCYFDKKIDAEKEISKIKSEAWKEYFKTNTENDAKEYIKANITFRMASKEMLAAYILQYHNTKDDILKFKEAAMKFKNTSIIVDIKDKDGIKVGKKKRVELEKLREEKTYDHNDAKKYFAEKYGVSFVGLVGNKKGENKFDPIEELFAGL